MGGTMLDHFIVLDGVIVSSAVAAVTIAKGLLGLLLAGMTRRVICAERAMASPANRAR